MGTIMRAKTVASIAALALAVAGFTGCSAAADAETPASSSVTTTAQAEATLTPSPTPTKPMTHLDYAKHDMKFSVERATSDDPYGMLPMDGNEVEFAKVVSDDGTVTFSAKEAEAAYKAGMNTYLKLRTDPEFSRATRNTKSDEKALGKYKTLSPALVSDAKKAFAKDGLFNFVPYHFVLSEWLWAQDGSDLSDHEYFLIDTTKEQSIGFQGLDFVAGRADGTGHKILEFNFTEVDRYKLADDHGGEATSVVQVIMAKINGNWMVDGLHWNAGSITAWDKDGKDVLEMENSPF